MVFNADGSLSFLDGTARSDVSIANGSRISASDFTIGGGSVTITADELEIANGSGVSVGTVGESELDGGPGGRYFA